MRTHSVGLLLISALPCLAAAAPTRLRHNIPAAGQVRTALIETGEANKNGDARVRGDPHEWSVPEVLKDGTWYPICGHHFWDNNEGAASVCKSMGFADGGEKRIVRGRFSEDALDVGRCNAGEHLNKCTGGSNEFALTDWCKAGHGISVEVKCNVPEMMTTTINTVPETPDEPQTAGEDEAAIPIETCDEPSSEQECSEAAKAAGVLEGGAGYPFAGNWKTRGCYAYAEGSGTYAGRAYWGVNTDGIEPTASKGRYRVCMPSPTTTTMTALPSTTTTTTMPASRTCDPNPCKNGASCSGDGVCTCKGDFVGIDCAVPRGCSDQAVSDDHWLHSPCAHVNTALPYPKEADAVPEEPTR